VSLPPGPLDAAGTAALYRLLLERATRSAFSEADAGRWPLEADPWLRPAATLRAALLGGALSGQLEQSAASELAAGPWWRSAVSSVRLRAIWASGRSLRAEEALGVAPAAPAPGALPSPAAPPAPAPVGPAQPAAFAALFERRLGYHAPDAPPQAVRPDYKFMQGDRGPRRKAKTKGAKAKKAAPNKAKGQK
jgi:hypothetical protein